MECIAFIRFINLRILRWCVTEFASYSPAHPNFAQLYGRNLILCSLLFHTVRIRMVICYTALSLAAQRIVVGPVCGCVTGGRAVSVTTITRIAYIDIHQTGSVGAGGDHLQLIKFWRSCAPGKGVCGGAKIFGSTYYSQHAVFASL